MATDNKEKTSDTAKIYTCNRRNKVIDDQASFKQQLFVTKSADRL